MNCSSFNILTSCLFYQTNGILCRKYIICTLKIFLNIFLNIKVKDLKTNNKLKFPCRKNWRYTMEKIKITTPENIEVEYTLAGLGSRTGAALIDMMIQGAMFLILGIALLLIWYFSPGLFEEYYGWIIGGTLFVSALISYSYFIVMELNMNGMTPGKKIFRIRTIRNNGQPITIKHSAIRNLFRVFLDTFGVGIVLIFFTKEHKRVGDFLASTIVVTEEKKVTPITLEGLQKISEHYRYLISEEEYEILREYAQRKSSMGDSGYLKEEIKNHFRKKFDTEVNSSEWDAFIDGL